MKLLRRGAYALGPPDAPEPHTPEWERWLLGDLTLFCGKGYHEGSDKGPVVCEGTISMAGVEAPCLCECHGEAQR